MMRKFIIQVNGTSYEVEVEEVTGDAAAAPAPVAAPVAAPTPAATPAPAPKPAAAAVDGTAVTAPMPGNILSVNATVGQSVKAGDTLMVLEAMKMENEILCPQDGVVKTVAVAKGAAVQTGDLLVVVG